MEPCAEAAEESRLPEPTPPPQPPADHPLATFYQPGSPWWCRGDNGDSTLPATAASHL
jgi:hypothetical protein